jgi:hypothetical protein
MGQGTGLRLFVRHANGLGACFAPSLLRKFGAARRFLMGVNESDNLAIPPGSH